MIKSIRALIALSMCVSVAQATDVTGAGSSFVNPIISKWADKYKKETGVKINYQSVGSGAGIKQIKSKTVDFGASDMPLSPEELTKEGLLQFPIINGADVAIINVPGIQTEQLKLDGNSLAEIFMGRLKKWNDPMIAKQNPELKLPDKEITVVHRSDGSGTTFIFTNYLSKVSSEWKTKVGEGTAVNWPTGLGGKGNEGVATYVKQTEGSIGYVEYAYALENKLAVTQMKNQFGLYIKPNQVSFNAAVAGAEWSKAQNYYLILTNAPGKNSWPIAGSTFVLLHKTQDHPEQALEIIKFFKWAFANGNSMANELHYVPLNNNVSKMIETTWKSELKDTTGKNLVKTL